MGWSRFWQRRQWNEERARELEAHLQMETEDNIARGMSPSDARTAACRKLGNTAVILEDIYRMNSLGFFETLWQDLRFGARMLAKNPGFTAVAVMTLALGIGANTAIFSVVNATLIQPLAYGKASRLVMIWETQLPDRNKQNVTSPATFLNWQERNPVFEQTAAFFSGTGILTGGDAPEEVGMQFVTPNFFSTLGTNALLGRTLTAAADGVAGADAVVVLSFELWQRRYGSDPNILGSKIMVSNKPRIVVGVMPRGFGFYIKQQAFTQKQPQLWAPMTFDGDARTSHGRYLQAIGLLRPGVTLQQARAEMQGLASVLEKEDPESMKNWSVNLVPLRAQLTGEFDAALKLLLAAVGLVLLIACANVGTLFLARATARRHEIAVRMALGAASSRVVRQILTESCLIAACGGLAGLLLAYCGTRLFKNLAPAGVIPLEGIKVDGTVLCFAGAIAVATGLLFGAVPAWQAAHTSPREPLQEGGRVGTGSPRESRARSIFVIAEVGLALVLLIGSGLLIRSFGRLVAVDPGFNPKNVLTAWVQLPNAKYDKDERRIYFFARLLERLRALPGVRSASADGFLPFAGIIAGTGVDVEGRPKLPMAEKPVVDVALVEPHFFETMGIPLLQGRTFTDREGLEVTNKVVISREMAKRLWPGEDPIGKHVTIYMKRENVPSEVIGVVGDVRHAGLDADVRSTAYWPYPVLAFSFMTLVVRTDGDPMALAPALRQTILHLDKDQPMSDLRSMEQLLSLSLARTRFATLMMAAFAAMALLLAVLGIYGVVSYNVEERAREIGIRLALGASRESVLHLVLRQGMRLAAIGIAIGALASLAASRLLVGLLFGTKPTDVITILTVLLVLGSIALLACYVAARRATAFDPVVALRCE